MLRLNTRRWFKNIIFLTEKIGIFKIYAATLFLIMLVIYDSFVWKFGFFYDDWEGVFLYKLNFSFKQIWEYFLIDRPFSAGLHYLFSSILGSSVVGWHILGLFLNWAAILFFVLTILEIWPEQVVAAGWIGFLLGVYPGISRQFVLLTSIPHYSSMFLFSFSLWVMFQSFRFPRYKIILTITAISLGLLQTLLIEFFTGLELIRIFLIYCSLCQRENTTRISIKLALFSWLPYSIIFPIFIFYRFVLLQAMQVNNNIPKHALKLLLQFPGNPLDTLAKYANMILQDFIHGTIYVWVLPVIPTEIELQSKSYVLSWIIGLVLGLSAYGVMLLWDKKNSNKNKKINFSKMILLIAILAVFLGGLPGWITGRQGINGRWASRFLFGQMIGMVPFIILIIIWFIGKDRRFYQHIIFTIILIGSISLQYRTQLDYVKEWEKEKNFYWQLKWRIPGLSSKAFLVSPKSTTLLTVDYQMAYAVNVIYASGYQKTNVPVWWFNGPEELRSVKESQPHSQREVGRIFRNIEFSSDMNYAVPIIYNSSRGCLMVADPIYQNAPLLDSSEQRMFLTSHPEMILQKENSVMPEDVFGVEPPHSWCYYFLKADLARQYKDWDSILQIWQQASGSKLEPGNGIEYLPFIEGYAMNGKWTEASELTKKSKILTEGMDKAICSTWKRLILLTPASKIREGYWNEIIKSEGCS